MSSLRSCPLSYSSIDLSFKNQVYHSMIDFSSVLRTMMVTTPSNTTRWNLWFIHSISHSSRRNTFVFVDSFVVFEWIIPKSRYINYIESYLRIKIVVVIFRQCENCLVKSEKFVENNLRAELLVLICVILESESSILIPGTVS